MGRRLGRSLPAGECIPLSPLPPSISLPLSLLSPSPSFSLYQPKNPMDDKVISIKHETLRPDGSEVGVVHSTVACVEKALKMVSDDLLIERCKMCVN